MSIFDRLNGFTDVICGQVIENQNLCKLLHYNDASALSQPDIEDASILLDGKSKRIYTDYWIPSEDIQKNQASSYLVLFFDRFKPNGFEYKDGLLMMMLFTQKELNRIDNNKRLYAMSDEISKMFHGKHVLGLGKMKCEDWKFSNPNSQYIGYVMPFSISDFEG